MTFEYVSGNPQSISVKRDDPDLHLPSPKVKILSHWVLDKLGEPTQYACSAQSTNEISKANSRENCREEISMKLEAKNKLHIREQKTNYDSNEIEKTISENTSFASGPQNTHNNSVRELHTNGNHSSEEEDPFADSDDHYNDSDYNPSNDIDSDQVVTLKRIFKNNF